MKIRLRLGNRTFSTNSNAVRTQLEILNDILIGPYFLPNRLNVDKFFNFIRFDFSGLLDNVSLVLKLNSEFQLDDISAHYVKCPSQWLNRHFGRTMDQPWWAYIAAARSPDQTPLDFFAWRGGGEREGKRNTSR